MKIEGTTCDLCYKVITGTPAELEYRYLPRCNTTKLDLCTDCLQMLKESFIEIQKDNYRRKYGKEL